jgi:hypothetical protein
MKLPNYTLIDTAGQLTAVIDKSTKFIDQSIIGQQLLRQYPTMGQVAFVTPTIRMMGGELSINGTIAAQYFLKKYSKPMLMRVDFPKSIVKQVLKNEVIFSGIKYKLANDTITKTIARNYCGNDKACGFIFEKNSGEIVPTVYVKATDTLITETACGSASLAYSLLTSETAVVQPSGQTIYIKRFSDKLQVSTICKEIKYA